MTGIIKEIKDRDSMFSRPFESENKSAENKNRAAGLVVTIIVHALLFLLLLVLYISPPDPPFEENAGGTAVNFGTVDEGMGDQQQFTAVPVQVQPQEVAPTPPPVAAKQEDNLETQEAEDAAEVEKPKKEVKKQKVKPNPEADYKPAKKPVAAATPVAPKPTVNNDALFAPGAPGATNHSKGDGNGHKAGDQGKPNGDVNSSNYTGNGSGNGSGDGPGSGHGPGGYGSATNGLPSNVRLTGRSVRARNKPQPDCGNVRGKVVIEIKVNKLGRVIDARFTQSGSSTGDECLIAAARQAALKYSFDENSGAAESQTGSITFVFGIKE